MYEGGEEEEVGAGSIIMHAPITTGQGPTGHWWMNTTKTNEMVKKKHRTTRTTKDHPKQQYISKQEPTRQ